jgi:hypothetical protein
MVRRRDIVVDGRAVFVVLGLGVVSLLTACNGGAGAKLLAVLAIGQPSGAGPRAGWPTGRGRHLCRGGDAHL